VVGGDLVFVATSFADVPRNPESPRQHPDVLIYRIPIQPGPPPARRVFRYRF
jgi:hypothetical protein